MDELMADIWEGETGNTSQQLLWTLNCLTYAGGGGGGGEAVEILGERMLNKVSY